MRKLDRAIAAAPACLARFHHGQHHWDDVNGADKEEIRACLQHVQGRRCAYCEGDIDSLGQHIEHFRRKRDHPALTFDWGNLFWSCDQTDSCGHYKDRGAGPYNVVDLIDPCCDDPDAFFRFRADGTISIRPGLTQDQERRAIETLRVFGLNPQWGRLRNMRKQAVAGYVNDATEAIDAGLGPNELAEYFVQELQVSATLPFSTAIRHVLTGRP